MKDKKKFVIFAHSGTYDKLYQIITLAITAASMGRETYIFLFFWALKRFVNEEYDEGKTILQAKCPVEDVDTPESLAQKIHALEYEYFPKAIEKLL